MTIQERAMKILPLILLSFLFKYYAAPYLVSDERDIVSKYLYNDKYSAVKPYMWIYIPMDENSRKWDSFNERKTMKLNTPYLEYCLKTLISKNESVFNVCVVTDNDLADLIPEWTYRINEMSVPIKDRARRLAKMKLLYHYGGIVMPPTLLCLQSVRKLYSEVENGGGFCVECDEEEMIMGSKKNNENLKAHINSLSVYMNDMSNETEFNNLMNISMKDNIREIGGSSFGIEDKGNNKLGLEVLLGQGKIAFEDDLYGIYFPKRRIESSSKYGWFCSIEETEIKTSAMFIAKYFTESET